jgi:hypothetical protein
MKLIYKIIIMKKTLNILLAIVAFGNMSLAQTDTTVAPKTSNAGYEKFQYGLSFYQNWTSIEGNTPEYFYKPSVGGGIRVEYYPLNFLGFTAGATFQQRGAGVIAPDTGFTAPSINTYRLRLRFNYFEFPIAVILRTPHGIAGGSVRLSGSVGIAPSINAESNQVWHSVEDGFHISTNVDNDYAKSDMNIFASFGPDINTWGSTLQVHLIASFGTKNVYNSSGTLSKYNGKNRTYGLRLSWMF